MHEEEKCETCCKWFRKNDYKGACTEEWREEEFTYAEDWCEHWESLR